MFPYKVNSHFRLTGRPSVLRACAPAFQRGLCWRHFLLVDGYNDRKYKPCLPRQQRSALLPNQLMILLLGTLQLLLLRHLLLPRKGEDAPRVRAPRHQRCHQVEEEDVPHSVQRKKQSVNRKGRQGKNLPVERNWGDPRRRARNKKAAMLLSIPQDAVQQLAS